MPRAVVILPSTSYRAADFVRAAEALEVDLVVASEQPPPFDMGDRYVEIDCTDPERAAKEVIALGDDVPLDGVVAADDGGVVVAALVGNRLGLPSNTPAAAEATRDKLAMRRLLDAAETPQPRFRALGPGEDAHNVAAALRFPLVIKPVDRSASQGVMRIDAADDLDDAIRRVRRIIGDSEGDSFLLLEESLTGEEVAVEGLLADGELTVLAIFDKPDTSQGPFFAETILVTPSRLPHTAQDEVVRVARSAVSGLGLTHGPVHIELRHDQAGPRVLEVAARSIGGLCSRSLSFGLMGTTLETLILRNALAMEKPELIRERSASGVLMIPIPQSGTLETVKGVDEVRGTSGITGVDLTISPGSRVLAPPEGDRYLGFVFARSSSPEVVEDALRAAMARLEVIVI